MVKFDISNNSIRSDGGKALANALKDNLVMTDLNIASNILGYSSIAVDMSGVSAIANVIPTIGALTSLNVSDNNLANYGRDMSGIKALAAAIPECK